jgi:hypothetical protein
VEPRTRVESFDSQDQAIGRRLRQAGFRIQCEVRAMCKGLAYCFALGAVIGTAATLLALHIFDQ